MLDISQISNSIVNKSSTIFDDSITPYSYLKFITFFNVNDKANLINEYNEYIDIWSETKKINRSPATHNNLVRDKYFELLNDINLTYTNSEEKRFLSLLDLNNETDRSILIPYYVDKINEITKYFITKRDDIKFAVHRNQNLNSKTGISDSVINFIRDELLNNTEYEDISEYTINALTEDIEVDVVEKYDTFSHYYDIDPRTTSKDFNIKSNIFNTYFTSNVLDYDKVAFIDKGEYLINAIKQYPTFILDIGFGVSFVENKDDIGALKPRDFIDHKQTGNFDDLNINTCMGISQLYAGADIYCISSINNINHLTKVYDAQSPYANTLNKKHTSIQVVATDSYVDSRSVGGFFVPTIQNISFYTAYNKEYNIKSNVSGICYFPDPNVCGNIYNTSLIQLDNYPLTWKTSLADMFYQKIYPSITGIPNNTYQDFHGAVSDNNVCDLNRNFESIYNHGKLTNYKVDIYGNEYGIFKLQNTISPNANISTVKYISSLNTENGNNELISYDSVIFDGGDLGLAAKYGESDITSDYKEWPDAFGEYYYDILLECGLPSEDNAYYTSGDYRGFPRRPYFKSTDIALQSDRSMSAVFWEGPAYNNVLSSSILYDCGGDFEPPTIIETDSNIPYIPNNSTQFKTITSQIIQNNTIPANMSIYAQRHQLGTGVLKYSNTDEIVNISSVLSSILGSDNNYICANLMDIDIIQDVIILTSKKCLSFIKIDLNDAGKIHKTVGPALKYNISTNDIPTILSNYFYIEKLNAVIFAELKQYKSDDFNFTTISKNELKDAIIPTIRILYLDDMHEEVLFTKDGANEAIVKEFFIENFEDKDYNIMDILCEIETPIITYNSMNNLFSLTCVLRDLVGLPHIYNISFLHRMHSAEIISVEMMYATDTKYIKLK